MDRFGFLVVEYVIEDGVKTFYQEWKTGRSEHLENIEQLEEFGRV